MNGNRYDDLLLNLYACPTEQHRWPELLDRVCHEAHARSAVIQVIARGTERARSIRTIRDSNSEVARVAHERYMGDEVNPRMEARRYPFLPRDRYALRDRDLFSADDPAYADLKERLAAIELGSFMSVGAPLPTGERVALVLHRDIADSREFDADEEAFARALTPHLLQVLRIDGQLHAAQSHAHQLEQAIDNMRCGLIVCEADGRVCWANGAARNVFARREQAWLCAERLVTCSQPDTNTLRRMIAETAREADSCGPRNERVLVLRKDSAAEPLQVMLLPVGGSQDHKEPISSSNQGRVLLILSSPGDTPSLPAPLIGQLFALSPAESRLTAALCRGETVEDYARAAGVTLGTARFQVKQVLAKMQVSRQSELVRRVCSSVIAYTLPPTCRGSSQARIA